MFNYDLPGHADHRDPRRGARADEPRCAACRLKVTARTGIQIAGVWIHLRCALDRRGGARP
jgi:hypothetical protein